MAYNNKLLKAVGAGSGMAPAFFTYFSDVDDIATIGAENYFLEAFGALEAEDIIMTVASNGTRILIVATYTVDPEGQHTIDVSESLSFLGDVRDTDGAGFLRTNVSKVVDGGAKDVLFTPYTYRNNSDTIGVMQGANYFLEGNDFLEVGDFIYAIANDGFIIFHVNTVTATSVTVGAITLA